MDTDYIDLSTDNDNNSDKEDATTIVITTTTNIMSQNKNVTNNFNNSASKAMNNRKSIDKSLNIGNNKIVDESIVISDNDSDSDIDDVYSTPPSTTNTPHRIKPTTTPIASIQSSTDVIPEPRFNITINNFRETVVHSYIQRNAAVYEANKENIEYINSIKKQQLLLINESDEYTSMLSKACELLSLDEMTRLWSKIEQTNLLRKINNIKIYYNSRSKPYFNDNNPMTRWHRLYILRQLHLYAKQQWLDKLDNAINHIAKDNAKQATRDKYAKDIISYIDSHAINKWEYSVAQPMIDDCKYEFEWCDKYFVRDDIIDYLKQQNNQHNKNNHVKHEYNNTHIVEGSTSSVMPQLPKLQSPSKKQQSTQQEQQNNTNNDQLATFTIDDDITLRLQRTLGCMSYNTFPLHSVPYDDNYPDDKPTKLEWSYYQQESDDEEVVLSEADSSDNEIVSHIRKKPRIRRLPAVPIKPVDVTVQLHDILPDTDKLPHEYANILGADIIHRLDQYTINDGVVQYHIPTTLHQQHNAINHNNTDSIAADDMHNNDMIIDNIISTTAQAGYTSVTNTATTTTTQQTNTTISTFSSTTTTTTTNSLLQCTLSRSELNKRFKTLLSYICRTWYGGVEFQNEAYAGISYLHSNVLNNTYRKYMNDVQANKRKLCVSISALSFRRHRTSHNNNNNNDSDNDNHNENTSDSNNDNNNSTTHRRRLIPGLFACDFIPARTIITSYGGPYVDNLEMKKKLTRLHNAGSHCRLIKQTGLVRDGLPYSVAFDDARQIIDNNISTLNTYNHSPSYSPSPTTDTDINTDISLSPLPLPASALPDELNDDINITNTTAQQQINNTTTQPVCYKTVDINTIQHRTNSDSSMSDSSSNNDGNVITVQQSDIPLQPIDPRFTPESVLKYVTEQIRIGLPPYRSDISRFDELHNKVMLHNNNINCLRYRPYDHYDYERLVKTYQSSINAYQHVNIDYNIFLQDSIYRDILTELCIKLAELVSRDGLGYMANNEKKHKLNVEEIQVHAVKEGLVYESFYITKRDIQPGEEIFVEYNNTESKKAFR